MPTASLALNESIDAEIKHLCAIGDALAAQGEHAAAVAEYDRAWQLVPEPKNQWEASTWILAAIGDACFLIDKFKSARQALEYAMVCPGAIGNPFIHLRLGQVLFEAGELDLSADELIRAYMGGGEDIFLNDDTKYLRFLKTRAQI
ncbi:hypothetical protein [Undibacterium sp. Di24W]|uniref:hypothetical protein n=1 Tax=Undibacterium sp. Di24W TaxID=3413033 RepID=UPI003BF00887